MHNRQGFSHIRKDEAERDASRQHNNANFSPRFYTEAIYDSRVRTDETSVAMRSHMRIIRKICTQTTFHCPSKLSTFINTLVQALGFTL